MATQVVEYLIRLKDQFTAPLQKIKKQADELNEKLNQLNKKAETAGGGFSKMASGVSGMLAGIGIAAFANEVVGTLGKFERYEAVLTNTFGSKSAAQAAMRQITELAANTPFSVDQLTDSYVKLANRGFVPTAKQLTSLGDLAASVGKPFDQLTEAVLDAQTGEFERLKEFGIKASKAGDKVTVSFKGQTTTIQNSEKAIRDYILGLGQAEGVAGAMAAISATTEGKLSNLGDTFDSFKLTVGNAFRPAIHFVIEALGKTITTVQKAIVWLQNNTGVIKGFAVAIGIAGGALLAYHTYMNMATIATNVMAAAQRLLNITMLANPIGLVIAAVAVLIGYLVYLWNTSEKVRGVMTGLWEGAKQVFSNIANAAMAYLGGLGDLLVGIFTLDLDKIKAGLTGTMTGLKDFYTGAGKGVGEAFNKGQQEGIEGFRAEKKAEADKKAAEDAERIKGEQLLKDLQTKGNAAGGGVNGKKDKKDKNTADAIGKVAGGRPTNFTLNINKLVEKLEISTTNLTESSAKVKEEVSKILLAACNDVSIAGV